MLSDPLHASSRCRVQKKEKKEKKKEKKASSSEPKRKIQDFYSFPNIELGRGAFSIVHLAKCNETGDEVRSLYALPASK